jgi:hypothetical protein
MIELLLILSLFQGEFDNVTAETGLEYLLIEHEDQSVTLYSYLPNATDVLTSLAGYPNVESLSGSNGIIDVSELSKSWDLSND